MSATGGHEIVAQSVGGPSAATHIRGTMLVNSLRTLRSSDRIKEYFGQLPTQHHSDVQAVTAQSWVPMDLAVAHYAAMAAVFLDVADQIRNGRVAAERTQQAHMRTVIRTLCAVGTLDMWDAMARFPSMVARSIRGGQCVVRRVGPKDARVEFTGFPFFSVGYMHNSMQGTCQGALEVLGRRVFIRQDLSFRSDASMALQISWV